MDVARATITTPRSKSSLPSFLTDLGEHNWLYRCKILLALDLRRLLKYVLVDDELFVTQLFWRWQLFKSTIEDPVLEVWTTIKVLRVSDVVGESK